MHHHHQINLYQAKFPAKRRMDRVVRDGNVTTCSLCSIPYLRSSVKQRRFIACELRKLGPVLKFGSYSVANEHRKYSQNCTIGEQENCKSILNKNCKQRAPKPMYLLQKGRILWYPLQDYDYSTYHHTCNYDFCRYWKCYSFCNNCSYCVLYICFNRK